MKWLIVYDSGIEEVVEAEDFLELHGKVDSDSVMSVIRLNSNVDARSYSPYR